MSSWNAVSGNLALSLEDDRGFEAPRAFSIVEGRKTAIAVHGRQSNTMRLLTVSFALLLVFAACVIGRSFIHAQQVATIIENVPRTEITVSSGDTLWDVAQDHALDGIASYQLVEAIEDWNDLESAQLMPGQKLVVPAMR